jgi:serine/threonine-protein kinase
MIGRTLDRYRIESKLGEGGMGVVYRARDTQLDRSVAIKVLPPGLLDADRRERLLREARAASGLNHAGIVTVHDIRQADGIDFIVMEHVEGRTLDRLIGPGGGLDVREALRLAAEIADALAAAHATGIVHRDLKPSNVMITPAGRAKLLDFGLAKLVQASDASPDSSTRAGGPLTEPGALVGTAAYMSPEQAEGRPLDARSDIFSFGSLLYEMATGRSPFAGDSKIRVLARILSEDPAPPRQLRPALPAGLEAIVQRCLRKDPARRYQTAADLRAALLDVTETDDASRRPRPSSRLSRARVPVVLLFGALTIAGAYFALQRRPPATGQPEIKSLAVLPLSNLTGDPQQEHFADGITDALISSLAQIPALSRVTSRTSVMRYKGGLKPLPEIARELNVDGVIEGAVQRAGARVRVTAKLIPASTDSPLWARDFEFHADDVLALQSEVARAVADEIRIQVTAQERSRLAAAEGVDAKAHEAYLLGRSHSAKNNEQDWARAIAYFEQAIRMAPDFAAAYAGLSDAWLMRGVFGFNPIDEIEPPARAAASRALQLNDQLAAAHTSLANLKLYRDWDWSGAEAEFKRALELDGGSLDAHRGYGHLLMCLGRHDEAIREGRIAAELDPLSAETQTALGRFLYRARRYEEALAHLQLAVEREPRSIGANYRLADSLVELRRYDEALAAFERGRVLTRDESTFQAAIARVHALAGRKQEARRLIEGSKAAPIAIAGVSAALGDRDQAFRILAQAVEERKTFVVTLKEDPGFDSLHGDPRWQDLLRRMNFPEK